MQSGTSSNLFDQGTSTDPLYAEVVIPIATPQTFTWSIPPSLRSSIQLGVRVEVNLGQKRRYAGLIKRVHDKKPEGVAVKPILQVLDRSAIVYPIQFSFWEWMAQYYLCSEGEVMAAALPAYFKLSSESWLCYLPEFGDDFRRLNDAEYMLAEALLIKKHIRVSTAREILGQRNVYDVINRLVEKGVAYLTESLEEKYIARFETIVTLSPALQEEPAQLAWLDRLKRAHKQRELLLAYLDLSKRSEPVRLADLLQRADATGVSLNGLIEKGIIQTSKQRISRIERPSPSLQIDFLLSDSQQRALGLLNKQWETQSVCLLRGVTGSGKTHVYIQLIAEALKRGKQVLYLLQVSQKV